MVDLVQIRKLAERKEDENFSFRRFLKTQCNLEPDEIDQLVLETTRRVWAGIDCTSCANCCRVMKPTFSEEEVERVAHRLGMARTCPIVYEVMEELKKSLGFLRARSRPRIRRGRKP